MAQPVVLTRVRIALAVGFAFVCGWVDTVCVVRYKAFSTAMTGNMFYMGYTIIYPKTHENRIFPDPIFYFLVICCYFLGIVLHGVAEEKLPRLGRVVGPIVAVCMMIEELAYKVDLSKMNDEEEPRLIVFFLAVIFAVQNMLTQRDGLKLPTASCTGHLHNVVVFFVEVCRGNATLEELKAHSVPVFIMLALVTGSCSSAVWDKVFGQCGALLPIAPLMMVLFVLHDFVFSEKPLPKEDEKDQEVDIERAEEVPANQESRGRCKPCSAETEASGEVADDDSAQRQIV